MEDPPKAGLAWSAPGTWARIAALAVGYYAAARLGLMFALTDSIASPVWPPTGLAIAAVAVWRAPALVGVALGALAIETETTGSALAAAGMTAGNVLEAFIGGTLLARLGGAAAFQRLRGIGRFGLAAALAPVASATLGVASLVAGDIIPPAAARDALWTWYLGDAAGALVVAPPLVLAHATRMEQWRWRDVAESLAALAVLLGVAAAVFGFVPDLGRPAPALLILLMPPLVWVGYRLGALPAAAALLGLDALAIAVTRAGHGPFLAATDNGSYLLLQTFVFTVAAMMLGLVALAAERRRFARDLETRVHDRTRTLESLNLRLKEEVEDRRHAEQTAHEAEHAAQMGTWRWDISKPHADWSPQLFRIYGLDPDKHVPTYEDYLTRVHPDDVARVKAATEAVFNDQRPYSHDERIRRPDGTWRNLHTWARAETDANGKLVALVGACQDITDRVAQEEKFRGLLESAPDAMVIVDGAGKIVLVNGQAEKLFGYTRGELLGQSIDLLVPEGMRGGHAQHRTGYMHEPRARPMGAGLDLKARRKDGSEVPVEISLAPLQTPEGMLVSSAIRDVTARKQAERALGESLERFRALSDASPIGIVHTTAAGHVDYANRAWCEITGVTDYKDADAVRRAVHPEDQPQAAAAWRACVKEGREFVGEMRFVRPDGSARLVWSRAVPVRAPDGTITGFVSAVEDITERRAAEAARLKEHEAQLELRRLREVADFKTNFLRTAAHELGTPLTPIKIQLRVLRDLLKRRPSPDEEKALAILDRNLDRLQVLVRDLLESARLQSGRMKLNPRSMDLAHTVHDVVETFQEPAIQTGILLDARVPTEMAMVGDPDRVTQVLYNLLSNAMKFTPAGGRVHVEAHDLGETVRVTVEDTGAGFTAEQASHLFQPFSQVHDPMQTTRAGSGLGLYICKGIVEQHGGGITAHSDGPGKGARFTFVLPRVARPPPAPTNGNGNGAKAASPDKAPPTPKPA